MKKDFKRWQDIKQHLDNIETRATFSVRDIWICSLGANIGDEQNGAEEDFTRPVVVLRKFNDHICWIVLLTKTRKDSSYYVQFDFIGNETSSAIISQVRTIDAKRLIRKIGFVSVEDFKNIKEKLKALLP